MLIKHALQHGIAVSQDIAFNAPNLYPAAGYNGTAGSGWGGLGVARPVVSTMRAKTDPARASLSCAEDNRQAMIADMVLTFFAAARSVAAGIGVSKVRVYCEGNYVDVTSVTPRTRGVFNPAQPNAGGYDGNTHIEWGQHVTLQHSGFTHDGWVEVFAESFPTDPAKANTVIGPILVKRKTGAYYDQTLTWGAGQTYPATDVGFNNAVDAAGVLCRTVGAGGSGFEHVRIKPVGANTYNPASVANLSNTYTNPGHLDIFCDLTGGAAGSLHITKATNGPCIPSGQFGLDFQGTRWGPGCKIDFARLQLLFAGYGDTAGYDGRRIASVCGAEIYNSKGANDLGGGAGGTTPSCWDEACTSREDGGIGGWTAGTRLFECNYHDMHIGPCGAQILRNVIVNNCGQDQLRPISADYLAGAVQWSHWYNVQIINFSLVVADTSTPAFTITGPAAVTVETTGTPDGTRQIVFRRAGVQCYPTGATNNIINSATAPGGVFTPDPGCYYVQDVVNAINARAAADGAGVGMNGVVATFIAGGNVKRAATIIARGFGGITGNLPATALSAAPMNFDTRLDIHGDGYQSQTGKPRNVNRVNCSNLNGAGQNDFEDYLEAADIMTINCAWTMSTRITTGLSRLIGDQSHCVHWHCTFAGQSLWLSTTANAAPESNYHPDADCEIQAGVFSGLRWETAGEVRDLLKINGNFMCQDNGETDPNTGLGWGTNYSGAAITTLLVDPYNLDITPKAAVLAHLQPRRVPFDMYGTQRGTTTASGAKVAAKYG